MADFAFTHSLTVIIPVFNSGCNVASLVNSLRESYPLPTEKLRFLFSDDASTEPSLLDFYRSEFFNRPDVILVRRVENGGFVKNVNSVLRLLRDESRGDDFLILNSDTQVFHRVFEKLQDAAYSAPHVATVTPITNDASAVSLFHFPAGGPTPSYLSPIDVSRHVFERAIGPKIVAVPHGVGCCLYVRWEAFLGTGFLDESFGRGCGAQIDWCRRAINRGWTHQVHPHAYVERRKVASFQKEEGIKEEKEILLKLGTRYPDFNQSLKHYFGEDPLMPFRITLALEVVTKYEAVGEFGLFIIHTEPEDEKAGGTELYSRNVQKTLSAHGFGVLEMFPCGPKDIRLRGRFREETFLQTDFPVTALPAVLSLLRPFARHLHVQHLLRWPATAMKDFLDCDFDSKTISIHDFFLACPSYNLITGKGQFCNVEPDPAKCNRCYVEVSQGDSAVSIDEYRDRSFQTLDHFDFIHCPSSGVPSILQKAFGERFSRLLPKVRIVPHDLSYAAEIANCRPRAAPLTTIEQRHIIFLGSFKSNKGKDLFIESQLALREAGFTFEALGFSADTAVNPAGLSVTGYRGVRELAELLQERRPGLVLLASIWPETFCYTFFEALLLAPEAIPVVSPLGHPASVVSAKKIGVVMEALTTDSLVKACREANRDRTTHLRNRLRVDLPDYFDRYIPFWNTGRQSSVSKLSHNQLLALSQKLVQSALVERRRTCELEAAMADHGAFWRAAVQRYSNQNPPPD